MSIIDKQQTTSAQKGDEHILVIKQNYLFPEGTWQGLKAVDFDHYLHIIQCKQEFHPRSIMETDETYKQIIPYLVFEHNNQFFLMQRKADASEIRLQNKYSLGIGGHIRKEDIHNSANAGKTGYNTIFNWAKREFYEEVNYDGNLEIEPLGILNDDSNDVGRVHIGFVFLLHGSSNKISIKSELKSGLLLPLNACTQFKGLMEQWSKLVLEYIQNNS